MRRYKVCASSLRCIIHVLEAEAAPWEDTHATVWDTQMESVLLDDSEERKLRESFLNFGFNSSNGGTESGWETDTGCQPSGVKSWLCV